MTKEELINELEFMRDNIKGELAKVNAQHDVLLNHLCNFNALISKAKAGDSDS